MWCMQEDPNIMPSMMTMMRILKERHAEVEDAPLLLEFAMRVQSAGQVSSSSCSKPHMIITSCLKEKTRCTAPSNSVLLAPRQQLPLLIASSWWVSCFILFFQASRKQLPAGIAPLEFHFFSKHLLCAISASTSLPA
ncbi:hypothetical protein L7F22_005526 [Adiantum nelumboides]|nr:hypothetical protein [Adiantum nelumboides]